MESLPEPRKADLVVCETCRRPLGPAEEDGVVTGQDFAAALANRVAGDPALAGVRVTTTRCLMACKRSCTVHLRAPGKMAYVVGDLGPEVQHVEALAGYLGGYLASATGVVPYKDWPDGIKGRFIARIPPLD